MKIAYLLADPGIGVFGTKGASVHVQEVVRALRADGHEVTVYCSRVDDHVPADLTDLTVRRVPITPSDGPAQREQAILATAHWLAKLAVADGPDLVFERYSLFSAAGAEVAEACAIPLIVEVNAPLIEEQRQHRDLVDIGTAQRTSARLFGRADLVSCVSEPVADWVRDTFSTIAQPIRPAVVPNGVNTSRIRPLPRHFPSSDSGPVTIGFVGTLKPWHGTDILLRAVAALEGEHRLDICGKGPELPVLQELAADLGIAERVTFRGAVPPEDMPAVLQQLDIAVAPYPPGDHYFSPLKVYEYLAAGLPTVASAIGTLPELLDNGRCGVLVPPGDVGALAAALGDLAADPQLRDRLSRRARTLAETEHDWRRRCRDILELAGIATGAGRSVSVT